MSLVNWYSKGSYFDYKSHRIFYTDEGNGEPILLIHGFPTSSYDWLEINKELKNHYRVITLDLIGFGYSDKPYNYKYSIFDQADVVECLLDFLSIVSVKIMCHDYGDTVVQEILSRFIEKSEKNLNYFNIESICFLNGGLFPEVHKPLFIQKLLLSPIGGLIVLFFTKKKLRQNFKKIFGPNTQPTDKMINDYWHLIRHNRGKRIFPLLINYLNEREKHRPRWVSALKANVRPMRLIDGTYDPISGKNIADRYKAQVPKADVVELHDIGHFPLIECPKLVLKHYYDFLNESAIDK